MGNIVIDTNVLYSWVGISVNPKFTPEQIESLSNSNKLYLTTPSLIEVINKYSNDITLIKMCLKPIIEEKLLIVGIGFLPLSNDTIKKIYNSQSLHEVHSDIKSIIEMKIDKEAEMLRFILYCIMAGIFNVIREDKQYKFVNQKDDSLFIYSSNVLLASNSQFVYDSIKDALEKGYLNNTEEKNIKEILSSLISTILNVWIMNYYFVKHSLLLDDFKNPDPKKLADLSADYKNDTIHATIRKHVNNPFSILRKKKYNALIEKFIDELKSHLGNHEHITEEALQFIVFQLNKTFQAGSKVNKNDVIDLLIIYSLTLKDFIVITLDKNMAESLRTISQDSYNKINSLCLV